ncbi:MAG: hypothetical protein CL944_01220 [Candidatus Diapherotrites archaeon]|uniref:Uncharacterized protein n=1 Tax=Candidatus Iainarchaeum sp. TaxID=3101447 RepID=A0A2D6LPD7_9ARCH|nr:hypothetical protein [Candidatus Diapherotrites archaeon]|tara:strand:+ start:3170 stop:4219 length:1050 start_codon:yes stop_codon:yes gene_type:complete
MFLNKKSTNHCNKFTFGGVELNMKNPFAAMALILIILLSLVAVADDTNATDETESDDDSDETEEEEENGRRGRPQNIDQNSRSDVRPIAVQEVHRIAKERREEIRANVHDAREIAKAKADEFTDIRDRLKNASRADKNVLRKDLRVISRETLLSQVNTILAKLQEIKESEHAPENIDELIAEFEGYQAALGNEDISREELIEISKEVKAFWKNSKILLLKRVSRSLNAKMNGLTNKLGTFIERTSALAEKLNERGIDTSSIDSGIATLTQDASDLNALHASLRERLAGVESREDAREVLEEIHEELKEMNKKIIADFRLVKELFKELRELNRTNATNTDTNSSGDENSS